MSFSIPVELVENRFAELAAVHSLNVIYENTKPVTEDVCPCISLKLLKNVDEYASGNMENKRTTGLYLVRFYDRQGVGSRILAETVDKIKESIQYSRFERNGSSIFFKKVETRDMNTPDGYFGYTMSVSFEI